MTTPDPAAAPSERGGPGWPPARDELLQLVTRQARARDLRAVGYQAAADIAQEAAVSVWQQFERDPHSFDDPKRFDGFIARVVKRKVLDIARSEGRRQAMHTAWESKRGGASPLWMNPVEQIAHEELAATLEQALAAMPVRRRETFHRVREDGIDHDSVARERGVSPSTVRKMIVRAHHDLRAALHQYWKEGE